MDIFVEAKQRGDIEIPELPYADAYQWDEPVTDPALIPDVTDSVTETDTKLIAAEKAAEILDEQTDNSTEVTVQETSTPDLRIEKYTKKTTSKQETDKTTTRKPAVALIVSNYKSDDNDLSKTPAIKQQKSSESVPPTARQSERESDTDMTYYIVGGSVAGGMVVVGGVVVTLGVLASQGKLGHAGFNAVPTSPA